MNIIKLLLGVLLLASLSACEIIGLPEEGKIIYDIDIPPNIPASVTPSTSSVNINENGGSQTLWFSIATQPKTNSNVYLVVQNPNPSRISTSSERLVFTNTDWGTKSLTVSGVNDFIQNGNAIIQLVLSFTGTDSRYNSLDSKVVTVTVIDDDAAGITITESGGSTSITEAGSTDTFDIVLNTLPTSNVGLSLSMSDSTEGTLSTSNITFTTSNWSTAQTVTVTGVNDNIQDGDITSSITVSLNPAITSDTNYLALANQTVTTSTIDDDVAGFSITQTSGSTGVTEMGGQDNVTVVLTSEPTADVTIDISSSDTGEVTVSPASITFSSGNYTTAQTVTFTGVDDFIDDTNITSTMTFDVNNGSSDSVYASLASQTLGVSNTDNDSAGITVNQSNGSTVVSEAAEIDYVSILLDTEPIGNVVLDISSSDTTEATVSPSTLTYTNLNWNVGQSITVTGVDDNVSEDNVSINSILAVNVVSTLDSQYDLLGAVTVPVIVTDDDSAGFTLAETGSETRVYETGTTDNITIVLTSEPTANVVFDVTSATTSEVTISTPTITFNASNWNTPQYITVRGADDSTADGNTTNTITVAINTTNTLDSVYDLVPSQNQSVINNDDDAAGITALPTYGLLIDEHGTTEQYTVVLDSLPTGNVIIDAVSGDTGEMTVSPAQLTFTTSNWNVQQTVTITGVDDEIDDGTINVNVTNTPNASTADVAYRSLGAATIVASTRDNDTAGISLALSGGNNNVTEPNTTDTFTAVLTSEPTGNVVIGVTSSDTTEVTVSPATLTFTSGNWNTPQTVTLTAANDAVVDGGIISTVTLAINTGSTADSVYDAVVASTTSVTTTDDDSIGITLNKTTSTITEGGSTDAITARLDAQPTATVRLDVASSDTVQMTVDTAQLAFNAGNWDTPQTVNITAVPDNIDDDNKSVTLSFEIDQSNTSDNTWLATPDANVAVTVVDNDTAGFTVSANFTISEAAGTGIFSVVLDSQPTDVVGFTIQESHARISISATSLTFNPSNWDTPQNIVVTGVDDFIDQSGGAQGIPVRFRINTTATLDPLYDALSYIDRYAYVTDDDNIGFTFVCCSGEGTGVTGNRLKLDEGGGTNSFTVVLDAQPTNTVVLNTGTGSMFTRSPASLTFNASNWNTPQTVTVTAVDDNFYKPQRQGALAISVNTGATLDNDFDSISSQSVYVIFKAASENDVQSITINEGDGVLVSEFMTNDTFTVALDIPPFTGQAAVLDITSTDTGEVTVSPAKLTFDTSNYNTPQVVTVTGVNDGIGDGNQLVNINITSNALDSTDNEWDSAISETVIAENADISGYSIIITETDNSTIVNEDGTTDTITVAPSAAVSVGNNLVVDISTAAGVSVSPTSVTFNGSNWQVPQTITITATNDSLANGTRLSQIDAGMDSISTTDFLWGMQSPVPSASMNATIIDDDTAGITIACCNTAGAGSGTNSGNRVSIAENGGIDRYTAVLTSQPLGDVILDIASGDMNTLVVNPLQLTFTPANWNTAQTVTMTAQNNDVDGSDVDNTSTITVNSSSADTTYRALTLNPVYYRVPDDDTSGYTLSTTTITVSENVTVSSFTVVLDSEPTGDVHFTLTNPDTTEATLSKSSLMFTAGDWNTPQNVDVTGVNDDLDDDNVTFNASIAINTTDTADTKYDALGPTNISITNIDNDEGARVTLTSDIGNIVEGTGSIQIQANQDITTGANTTVTLSATGGTASSSEYSFPTSITITAGTLQGTATFTSNNDFNDENTETVIIEITGVSGGGGSVEDGNQSITLSINDNDDSGFTIAESSGSTTVTEGGSSDTFTVVLDSKPTGNVRFDLSNDDTSEISYSPVALLFPRSNWNTPQTVTVSPVEDTIEDGTVQEEIVVSINTSITADSIYDSVASQTVTVNINDNDDTTFPDFALDNITPDYARIRLGWTAPSSNFDTSSSSTDSYVMYYTTVAPANRIPAGRMINENDSKTSPFLASKTTYVHGNLATGSTYYYRLAAVNSSGSILFTTNELSGSPLPIECTSTTGYLADNDADLLVYYPFEGDYGDKSPANGRDGSGGWPFDLMVAPNSGDVGFLGGCAYGKALYLDGYGPARTEGSFLQNTDFRHNDLIRGNDFTISLWMQPDGDMEQYSSMISTGENNKGPEFQIDVDAMAEPVGRVRIMEKGISTSNAVGDQAIIGTWYHIVAVYTNSNNEMRLWQNGVYKDDGQGFLFTCSSDTTPACNNTKRMWDLITIGRNRHGSMKWKGYIDEVKIFNRAFTQAEITALYQKSLPPPPSDVTAASVGSGSADIRLTWRAVDGTTSYTIYRVENSFPDQTDSIVFENANLDTTGTIITRITNVQAGCTTGTCTYTDSDPGLIFNRYYNYRISSVNAIGTGNPGPVTEVNAQAL